jgi:hypothetical protein
MQYRYLAAAALVALAGCVAMELPARRAADVDRVVADVVQTARAPTVEQKAALARAEQAFLNEDSPASRLRLAALLGTLPAPLHDDARAAELLEPLADPSKPGYGRMAALLAAQVAEHARLARELDRSMRERERSDKERDKREEALRQQLEALRGIERGILEREERLRRRPN